MRQDVFFYGLYMDPEILRAMGAEPRALRRAFVSGYRTVVRGRATLVRDPTARAYGTVVTLGEDEIAILYAAPGLGSYRPQPVVACFDDGTSGTVTTFSLADEKSRPGEFNAEYAARLQAILRRLGFPPLVSEGQEMTMIRKRALGHLGPSVGCLGYGAMVLEGYYGASDDAEAAATIRRALDVGMTMIDSADAYGNGHNERLVGSVIAGRRSESFVATKFGIVFGAGDAGTDLPTGWGFSLKVNGRPAYVRKALAASLGRLGVDVIDLWYAHYVDPATPIEETVGAMADAVRAGQVRYLGLSNATAAEVRRAHAVHPIAAVQYEYSLWRREAETALLPTLRELGIALVAWSPLGSGFLTGTVAAIDKSDFRRRNPRFAAENLEKNRDRFAPIVEIAKDLGVTPAQLALAWLLHQGQDVFPIPGTRRPDRVEENAKAAEIQLGPEALERIEECARPGLAAGATLL
jgi:aryl-alcohol dehydrogenase-like predicted oxidoreductase